MDKQSKCILYNQSSCKCVITSLTLLWMVIIFSFSAQPAAQSAGMSGGIMEKLNQGSNQIPVIGWILESGFTEHILRKGAHVAEYAVLGQLLLLCVKAYLPEKSGWQQAALACLLGVLYALSDEYHQTFVAGRSGELKDVCIDSLGVMSGVLLILGVNVVKKCGKIGRRGRKACI